MNLLFISFSEKRNDICEYEKYLCPHLRIVYVFSNSWNVRLSYLNESISILSTSIQYARVLIDEHIASNKYCIQK